MDATTISTPSRSSELFMPRRASVTSTSGLRNSAVGKCCQHPAENSFNTGLAVGAEINQNVAYTLGIEQLDEQWHIGVV